ncbi:gins complex subunit psf3 [Cystoisospora suis]|uniref:Gins complex subunit psf3 n=1 Tax=Cystoisospora suis TaxID=483139 RepID=A0A2C6KIK0_9APIC|nr:gins complex subunit psf3 [Cystoisospora suis]
MLGVPLDAMSFFDPFLRDGDSPTRDAASGPAALTMRSPNELSSSSASSSGLKEKEAANSGDSLDESLSDQFDLKAFHLHRRDRGSFGTAPRTEEDHTASDHENTESLGPGDSGSVSAAQFGARYPRQEGVSRGERMHAPRLEEDDGGILASTASSSGKNETQHSGEGEVGPCPNTGVAGPSREALEQEARREPFRFIDFEVVPCSPVEDLPRLAFLCPSAEAEVQNKMRPDLLRPSDSLQLPLYQAELLLNHGKAKVKFPSFYEPGIIGSLTIDPLAVNLASHSLFYFELGLYLCKMLPAYEWPVQHLQEILRNAWHRRRIHIITNYIALKKDFVDGLTFSENCTLNELREGETGPCGPFGS